MTSKLDAALALAARGFKVFPLKPNSKAPPLVKDWPALATTEPERIKTWWAGRPDANIGIHCSGMIVLDVDVKKGGNESLQFLEDTYGLPKTLTCRTPTGGRHLYYRSAGAVPNGVDALGSGVDTRTGGGYVVAPGSTIGSARYRYETDTPIADAPDWLVHKLGSYTPRVQSKTEHIPDAPAEVCNRAQEWLKAQAPAVEGDGGDAHTFKVACGVRDFGVSEHQALTLLLDWNDGCSPPWGHSDLAEKVRNAYAYGQNEPGEAIARAEDFPLVQPVEQPKAAVRTKAVRLGQLAGSEAKGPGYLVKGLLQRRTYAEVFGAPGEGKTFVALDIAYCVAAGAPWHARRTHAGVVLYLAYEGQGGLVKRAQALRKRYGDKDVPLYVASAAFNLREKAGREELGSLIASLPEKPVLIVLDTFARALMGGDENSAQDVGAFNSAIAALIESTGACVCIVHHSGKNKSAGARGSSALQGAIDTEIEVDQGRVTASKQRDMETGEPIGFKLVPVMVGLDEDGDEVTSCVVEPAAVSAAGPNGKLAGNAKRGFDVLCELRPTNAPITDGEWKEGCKGFLDKNLAQRYYDLKLTLKRKNYIVVAEDGSITRRCE